MALTGSQHPGETEMTYLEILKYQERSMNDMLCHCWSGFRQERQWFALSLSYLRQLIKDEVMRCGQ